jgi:hypothetical protein
MGLTLNILGFSWLVRKSFQMNESCEWECMCVFLKIWLKIQWDWLWELWESWSSRGCWLANQIWKVEAGCFFRDQFPAIPQDKPAWDTWKQSNLGVIQYNHTEYTDYMESHRVSPYRIHWLHGERESYSITIQNTLTTWRVIQYHYTEYTDYMESHRVSPYRIHWLH